MSVFTIDQHHGILSPSDSKTSSLHYIVFVFFLPGHKMIRLSIFTIDESVPEFSNQYQYQYQYQKKYSVQYEISTSTAQILTVPVLSTSTTNIDQKRREI